MAGVAAISLLGVGLGSAALGVAVNNTNTINNIQNSTKNFSNSSTNSTQLTGGLTLLPESITPAPQPTTANSLVLYASDGDLFSINSTGIITQYTSGGVIISGNYLNLNGSSAMQGTINLNSHPIDNVHSMSLVLNSVPTVPPHNQLKLFSENGNGLFSIDSNSLILKYAAETNLSSYLKLDGSTPMLADLNMNSHFIQNAAGLNLLVPSALPAPPSGTLKLYSKEGLGLYSIDHNSLVVQYASVSSLNSYLNLNGTSLMTGRLNLNSHSLDNADSLNVVTNTAPTPPSAGILKLYSSNGTNLFSINSSSVITQFASQASISGLVPYTSASQSPNLGNFSILAKQSQPVSLTKYSAFNNFPVVTATTDTSLLPVGSGFLGGLLYAANTTQIGMLVRFTASISYTLFSGIPISAMTIKFTINGTEANVFVVAGEQVSLAKIVVECMIQPGNLIFTNLTLISNSQPVCALGQIVYNTTVTNTFGLTASFSNVGGTAQLSYALMESVYQL